MIEMFVDPRVMSCFCQKAITYTPATRVRMSINDLR